MNKWLRGLIWLIVLGGSLFAASVIGGNLALAALTRKLAKDYGLTYEKLETSLFFPGFRPSVRLRGVTVRNPPGFPDGPALQVRELFASLYPDGLWTGRSHFREIRLDVEAIHVVVNARGDTNLDDLDTRFRRPGTAVPGPAVRPAPAAETARPTSDIAPPPEPVEPVRPVSVLEQPPALAAGGPPAAPPMPPAEPPPAVAAASAPSPDTRIDRLVLKLGMVTYDDFAAALDNPKAPRKKKSIDLAYEREFLNVTDLDRDVTPILEADVIPKTAALAADSEVRAWGEEAGLDPGVTEAVADLVSDPAVVDLARQLYDAYQKQKKEKKKK